MPCHSAMIEKPLTVTPDTPVEDVLAKMKKAKRDYAIVVDEDGILEGLFSAQILMKNLLPVSISVSGGVAKDINIRAAPGVAKRMRKVLPIAVSNVMERNLNLVRPETPTWEGINLLTAHGEPLIVVEDEHLKFLGMITANSAVQDIQKLEEG